MKRPILTAARTIAAAALVAAASISCPNPIDEELLLVVEDSLAPDLVIATPTPNSWYHGIVTVSGTLSDSSIEAGDGAGRLASLSFSVSDSSPLHRTVAFDADGNATMSPADPSFSWDAASGGFSFDVPTAGLFGYKVLTFVVADANGNEMQRDLPLMPYPYGPCLVLDEPVDLSIYDMIVAISGTVTDASGDSTTDEVQVLRWEATGGIYHELAIGPATVQPDGTYRSDNFTFDPLTGAFSDWFNSSTKTGPLSVKMRAMNSSVWSEVTVQLAFNGTGPAITLAPAAAGHNPGEYSSVVTTLIIIDGTVDMTNYLAGSLRYLVLQQVGMPKTGTIVPDPVTGAFSFAFNPDTAPVLSGNLTIEVSAQDKRIPPVDSTATHACYDDQVAPAAPVVSGPASPTNNTTLTWTWTGSADTVEFRTSMTSTSGPWTITPDLSFTTTRGAGTYTLWVQGRDAVGNWSSSGSARRDHRPDAAGGTEPHGAGITDERHGANVDLDHPCGYGRVPILSREHDGTVDDHAGCDLRADAHRRVAHAVGAGARSGR